MTTPAPEIIASLYDVRPGDLMFTSIDKPLSVSVLVKLGQLALRERVRLGRISIDHVGVVVEASRTLPAGSVHNGITYDTGVITAPRLVQAMPRGAEEIDMRLDKHWNERVAYVRLPEEWPGQADDAAAIARLFVTERIPYSFLSYVYLGGATAGIDNDWLTGRVNARRPEPVRLPRWSNGPNLMPVGRGRGGRLPVEAICSQLGDQALTLAGYQVVRGTRPQVVTPGMLFLSTWNRAGAIRGGAGVLG